MFLDLPTLLLNKLSSLLFAHFAIDLFGARSLSSPLCMVALLQTCKGSVPSVFQRQGNGARFCALPPIFRFPSIVMNSTNGLVHPVVAPFLVRAPTPFAVPPQPHDLIHASPTLDYLPPLHSKTSLNTERHPALVLLQPNTSTPCFHCHLRCHNPCHQHRRHHHCLCHHHSYH